MSGQVEIKPPEEKPVEKTTVAVVSEKRSAKLNLVAVPKETRGHLANVSKKTQGYFKTLETTGEEKDQYSRLLPPNWADMTSPEKIDFAGKVQHKGFFDYLMFVDSKLKEYFQKKRTAPASLKLYVTVFNIPSDSYSEEAKELLKTFVNHLNMIGRARLQYVQCSNPNMIEVREVR